MSNAARIYRSVGMMLVGPWLVWLGYAHLVRPYVKAETATLFVSLLSIVAGLAGFGLIGPPFTRWKVVYQLALFAIYAVGVILSQPLVGLLSICTTGDCL
ncbi:hypothetical protein LL268_18830 [Sphingobium lactosutens]|nr:hypothetical protein [Sphingobium lactosutens]